MGHPVLTQLNLMLMDHLVVINIITIKSDLLSYSNSTCLVKYQLLTLVMISTLQGAPCREVLRATHERAVWLLGGF